VAAARALVQERQPEMVTYADWQKIDAAEIAEGEVQQRPRVKFTRIRDMLAILGN